MSEPDHMRVGDVERASAVQQLEAHAAAGRLTAAELASLTDQARAATRRGELDALFDDLPGGFVAPASEATWETVPTAPSGVSDRPRDDAAASPVDRFLATKAAPLPDTTTSYADEPEVRWDLTGSERRQIREVMDAADRRRSPYFFVLPVTGIGIAAAFLFGQYWLAIVLALACGIVSYALTVDGRSRRGDGDTRWFE